LKRFVAQRAAISSHRARDRNIAGLSWAASAACCARRSFDQYLSAASLMESVAFVNAGKLECLSMRKSVNQQELAKNVHREPGLVSRTRNGKLLETRGHACQKT